MPSMSRLNFDYLNELSRKLSDYMDDESPGVKPKKKSKKKKEQRPYNIGDVIIYDASGCNRVGKIIDYGAYKNQYYIRDYHDETDTKFINERSIIEAIPPMLATDPRLPQYLSTLKLKKSLNDLMDNVKSAADKLSVSAEAYDDLSTQTTDDLYAGDAKIIANPCADIDTGYIKAEAVKDSHGLTVSQNFDRTYNRLDSHDEDIHQLKQDIAALSNKNKKTKYRQQLVNYYTNIGLICSLL